MQVLIVDDDDFALSVLENTITRMGFNAIAVHDGAEALDTLRNSNIRLVITDWDMPTMNGVELCRAIRRDDLSGYVYIIMLTGREGPKQRMEGLCAGADDFLNKPLDPEELLVCLKTAERILALETRDLALFALAKLAESRDSDAGSHVERVQSYARLVANHLAPEVKACHGVDDEYIRLLYQTSPLHDLGKVAIPDSILLKAGKLTPTEFAIMETHTLVGAKTLDAALARFPNARFLQMAREIAVTHHEKFDGSGYPHGLVGDQIPLCGRIVAIADVYDALTSRRVYKDALGHEESKLTILRSRGSHFDPEVVDAFLRAEEQILAVWDRLRDNVEAPPRTVDIPAPPEAPSLASPSECAILVVDDDPVTRDKVRELVAATGHTVYTAEDGEVALRLWQEHTPRVIVSDWNMPVMDGVVLCQAIRARSEANPVHFIMLTANTDKSRLLDAYEGGIDDFVSKPFDFEELLARVRAGIRTTKLHDDLVRRAAGSRALNGQLATINSRLERLSVTDELTGLFNRRMAMARLQEQWTLAERYGKPVSIAMIDIDHFKRVNDTYGHDVGDAILRQTAGILREQTRGTDVVCRVGGEEFLIIFPSQTIEEAAICAERFRARMEKSVFNVASTNIQATVSVGLAMRRPHLPQFTDLLKAADQALYAAKNSGRNKVCRAEDPVPQPQGAVTMAPSTPVTPPSDSSTRPPIDQSAVLKRCGNDAKFAAALMERFRTQAGNEVARLEAAFATGSAENVQRIAHSLKSMAAYVAADAPADLARQIEDLAHRNQLPDVPPLLTRLREEIARAVNWIEQNKQPAAA